LPGHSGFWFFVGLCGCVLGSLVLEAVGQWPIAAPGPLVVVILCLVYIGLTHDAIRKHYLVVALAVVSFLGAQQVGLLSPDRQQVLLDVIIGAGLIVAGLGDDRILRTLLQPPSSEAYVETA